MSLPRPQSQCKNSSTTKLSKLTPRKNHFIKSCSDKCPSDKIASYIPVAIKATIPMTESNNSCPFSNNNSKTKNKKSSSEDAKPKNSGAVPPQTRKTLSSTSTNYLKKCPKNKTSTRITQNPQSYSKKSTKINSAPSSCSKETISTRSTMKQLSSKFADERFDSCQITNKQLINKFSLFI